MGNILQRNSSLSVSVASSFTRPVYLLGDSTLDNSLYTNNGKAVEDHLQEIFVDSLITLCAKDGSVLANISNQLDSVNTHSKRSVIVLSIGGNDALSMLHVFKQKVSSVHDAMKHMHAMQKEFEKRYMSMLDAVVHKGLPVLICIQYLPRMEHYIQFKTDQTAAEAALSVIIDSIIRCASSRNIPLLDLRTVMIEPGDWANPIEPSEQGGLKIATAIAESLKTMLSGEEPYNPQCRIYRGKT